MQPLDRMSGRSCIFILAVLCLKISLLGAQAQTDMANNAFLMEQARAMIESGALNNPQTQPTGFSALLPNTDPQTSRLLNDNINKVTELINNYRQNGLSNMPNLPSLPGLNSMMRVPDKLLRAELSMLQVLLRMAQDMTQNPISATMNTPKDLALMVHKMAEQLEQ